ncbi:MAG: LPS assembly protein LptD [Gammaproteobacteria bacterium]
MRRSLLIILLWTAATVAHGAEADSPPAPVFGCPIPAPPPLTRAGIQSALTSFDTSSPADATSEVVDIITGDIEVDLKGPAIFKSPLVVRQGNREIAADEARFDRDSGDLSVSGRVEYRDPATRVLGDIARYNTNSQLFSVDGAEYDLYSLPARGSADNISLQANEQLSLSNVTYTTCARGKDDWLLRASSLKVNRKTGTATARNARLEFKGVPILYTPYLTYPVDNQRKSGLLLPDVGNSAQRGIEYAQPWYFNLAPNYDATLTPHYMSRRGIQTKGEFRYLSGNTNGLLAGEFLPNDDVTDQNRGLLYWFNRSLLPAGWRNTIDATDVTDSTYYEDLYSGLSNTSQTHLRRRMDFELFNETWFALLRVEDYETLDEAIAPDDRPYRRLPQLALNGHWPNAPFGLDLGLQSELTYFDRDTGVTGLRAHALPEVSLPFQMGPFQMEPYVGLDLTTYDLGNVAPGDNDKPGRAVPIYSLDLRTVLERVWGDGGKWLQTLEPRAQFVHIPFKDQSDLPVFDTIEPDFNLVQLFRRKRYVGLDRLSDTDQLNLGLTTRLVRASDGSQFLTATIGETQYFSSRDVVLPGDVPSNDSASDYLAELGMNFNDRWKVDLGYQWDSDDHVTRLAEARVLYQPDEYRVLNVSYRFRRDTVREIDIAGAWPLGKSWSIVGRYDYSLLDNQALERFVGLEYSTCCWGVRLVARRNLSNRDGESDSAVTLQLLLKGFGSSGSAAESMLDRGTLGYDRFDQY